MPLTPVSQRALDPRLNVPLTPASTCHVPSLSSMDSDVYVFTPDADSDPYADDGALYGPHHAPVPLWTCVYSLSPPFLSLGWWPVPDGRSTTFSTAKR